MRPIPEKFIERINVDLGEEQAAALCQALDGESPTSIRFNPYKIGKKPQGCGVPWNKYGMYLDQRPQFTFDTDFHAGVYYVQEAGSQFVGHLLEGMNMEGKRVLDMCASPGGKTTLYSSLVGLDGLVLANEIDKRRANILADNVRRWGLGNVVVSSNPPKHIANFKCWFDVVAVDAPCSGEGMFRKSDEAREEWNESNVKMCATRQGEILREAWQSLRAGGVLIYSTCTFNKLENEGVLEHLPRMRLLPMMMLLLKIAGALRRVALVLSKHSDSIHIEVVRRDSSWLLHVRRSILMEVSVLQNAGSQYLRM